MRTPLVIGLTGSIGSGCTEEVAKRRLVSEHKFAFHSLSELLKDKGNKAGRGPFGPVTKLQDRKKLQDYGDELRCSNAAVLAEECADNILEEFSEGKAKEFVVDSIRNPNEVMCLQDMFSNFYLVAVLAPQPVRFARIGEKRFNNDFSQFLAGDRRDSGENQPAWGQQVSKCVDLADYLMDNSLQCKTPRDWKENLWIQVDSFVELARAPGSRKPSDPELYMEKAYAASRSSKCNKRHVGAAIVHADPLHSGGVDQPTSPDMFVISTGTNHVPGHLPTCKERGDGDSGYCTKDAKVFEKLRDKWAACPVCRRTLDFGKIDVSAPKCSNPDCVANLKDILPGRQLDECISIHAEEAAILQIARLGGTRLHGTTLYTTTFPCLLCAKKILEVGIAKIVYAEPYPMREAYELLSEQGVKVQLVQFKGVTARSFFRLFR